MKKSEADMAQSERFKQAARELECDDDPERFAERVRKLVKTPPKTPRSQKEGDAS
jgi:hypothetical protein